MRFQNGVYEVTVSDGEIDMGGSTYNKEAFMIGIEGGNGGTDTADHDMDFTDVIVRNCYRSDISSAYWNADAFSFEDNTYNMTFTRCEAYNATDGGWDIKWNNASGNPPIFTDCIAIGNGRNYRFHIANKGYATMTNCLAAFPQKDGGISSQANFWATGDVKVYNSTFHSSRGAGYSILLEDVQITEVEFNDSIVLFIIIY